MNNKPSRHFHECYNEPSDSSSQDADTWQVTSLLLYSTDNLLNSSAINGCTNHNARCSTQAGAGEAYEAAHEAG